MVGKIYSYIIHGNPYMLFAEYLCLVWYDLIQVPEPILPGHSNDAIMSAMASQITGVSIFAQLFVQAKSRENIKAARNWPLWGESTGNRWIPLTKNQ